MPDYQALFSPIEVGETTLPNRVMMGSMHVGLEEESDGPERIAAFYSARVREGVGLIVTGGVSPNEAGRLWPGGAMMDAHSVTNHRVITSAVHEAGGKILLQLLHAGRYSRQPTLVAPSAIKSPISEHTPHALSASSVEDTIEAFVRAAEHARDAGYDGVELMGSEGYLINQFLAPATNRRIDKWGGTARKRGRFAVETVRRIRGHQGPAFLISFRLSVADLVPDGSSIDEITLFASRIQAAGADLINTGVGWHESRVPTIATPVPRAAFAAIVGQVKESLSIPIVASNRITTPELANQLIADGSADMVSMSRAFLADPAFLSKARAGRSLSINTCIGCNQACIDHTFTGQVSSCLVNPQACYETVLHLGPTRLAKRIAVIGAGPAGLSFAIAAAERGHSVQVFETQDHIGGQFDIARRIPGKQEFAETLRYFSRRIVELGIFLSLGRGVDAGDLAVAGFDEIVVATGVKPRIPDISGADHPSVMSYSDAVLGRKQVGNRVAILGAGGIGFDVALFLSSAEHSSSEDPVGAFNRRWGIDSRPGAAGSLGVRSLPSSPRAITLMQRKTTKPGAGLGKTTGWIHRTELADRGVEALAGVSYTNIDDQGLHFRMGEIPRTLVIDSIVLCTGQVSETTLFEKLRSAGISAHLIGGASRADEIDAKRAIRQGVELAAKI